MVFPSPLSFSLSLARNKTRPSESGPSRYKQGDPIASVGEGSDMLDAKLPAYLAMVGGDGVVLGERGLQKGAVVQLEAALLTTYIWRRFAALSYTTSHYPSCCLRLVL